MAKQSCVIVSFTCSALLLRSSLNSVIVTVACINYHNAVDLDFVYRWLPVRDYYYQPKQLL